MFTIVMFSVIVIVGLVAILKASYDHGWFGTGVVGMGLSPLAWIRLFESQPFPLHPWVYAGLTYWWLPLIGFGVGLIVWAVIDHFYIQTLITRVEVGEAGQRDAAGVVVL